MGWFGESKDGRKHTLLVDNLSIVMEVWREHRFRKRHSPSPVKSSNIESSESCKFQHFGGSKNPHRHTSIDMKRTFAKSESTKTSTQFRLLSPIRR